MKRTIINHNLMDLLDETAFVNYSWSLLSVVLVCTDIGFYFQIEDINDNVLHISATLKDLNKYFLEYRKEDE